MVEVDSDEGNVPQITLCDSFTQTEDFTVETHDAGVMVKPPTPPPVLSMETQTFID
jgi:hypothetical protein